MKKCIIVMLVLALCAGKLKAQSGYLIKIRRDTIAVMDWEFANLSKTTPKQKMEFVNDSMIIAFVQSDTSLAKAKQARTALLEPIQTLPLKFLPAEIEEEEDSN